MIIKIDVDGVIRNINKSMVDLYNSDFFDSIKVDDISEYDVDKVFPKIKKTLGITASDYFFKFNSNKIFLLSETYSKVRESIDLLRNNGHKVIIVTWQPVFRNKINTLYFLESNGIQYDDICFTKDKWMVQGDWLIDDNPEFITDERDESKKMMIKMPYNKDCNFPCNKANNLQEAVDIILGIEKNLNIFLIK